MPTVYITEALKTRHPDVAVAMRLALDDAGIPLVEIPGTGNIWIRDWMPIPVGDHFVKFRYKDLTERWPFLAVPRECWHNLAVEKPGEIRDGRWVPPMIVPPTESDIILDGGNVVRVDSRTIMTEQVFRDNPTIERHVLWGLLEHALETRLVIIPAEPGDELGHADGIVAPIDERTVFLNDYRSMRSSGMSAYEKCVRATLRLAYIETVPFPYAYDECREMTEATFRREFPDADDFNPGYGYYLNYLKVGNTILHPIFHLDRDDRAVDALLDAFPGANCVGIDCARLAYEGGLVHCTTWEF
jgi:agmatine deiminase